MTIQSQAFNMNALTNLLYRLQRNLRKLPSAGYSAAKHQKRNKFHTFGIFLVATNRDGTFAPSITLLTKLLCNKTNYIFFTLFVT